MLFFFLVLVDYCFFFIRFFLFKVLFIFSLFFIVIWLSSNFKYINLSVNLNYKFYNNLINYFVNFYFNNFFYIYLYTIICIQLNNLPKNLNYFFLFLFCYINNNWSNNLLSFWFFELPTNLNRNFLNYLVIWHPSILFYSIIYYIYFCNQAQSLKFYKKFNIEYIYIFSFYWLQILLWITFFLGSWWAAQELNWGLWWNWDIVEVNLLNICLLISFKIHYFFRNNYKKYIYVYLNIYIYIFFVNYFFLTKIDLFSSIHNFNNIIFLQKWYIYIIILYTGLILILLYYFMYYNLNLKHNVDKIFPLLLVIYSYTYYHICLIWYTSFFFVEKLNSLQFFFIILGLIICLSLSQFSFVLQTSSYNLFYLYLHNCLLSFYKNYKNTKFFKIIHFILMFFFINLFWFINIDYNIDSLLAYHTQLQLNKFEYQAYCIEFNYFTSWKFNISSLDNLIGFFEKYDIFYKNILFILNNTLFYLTGTFIKNLNIIQFEFFSMINYVYTNLLIIFYLINFNNSKSNFKFCKVV